MKGNGLGMDLYIHTHTSVVAIRFEAGAPYFCEKGMTYPSTTHAHIGGNSSILLLFF